MKYYLVRIFDGVESGSYGPFADEAAQDERAREILQGRNYHPDYDSLLWLIFAESGGLESGLYDHEHLADTGAKLHGPERLRA